MFVFFFYYYAKVVEAFNIQINNVFPILKDNLNNFLIIHEFKLRKDFLILNSPVNLCKYFFWVHIKFFNTNHYAV